MKNTKKLLSLLYVTGIILGASLLVGCQSSRSSNNNNNSAAFWQAVGGICSGMRF